MKSISSSIIDGIDSRVNVPVEKDEMVEKAVTQFINELPAVTNLNAKESYAHYFSLDAPALIPMQIDLVLQRLLNTPYKLNADIGLYVSTLIQRSYDDGHNGFALHTQDFPVHELCCQIKGSEGKRLNITVYGDTGVYTGNSARWISCKHDGNADAGYFYGAEDTMISVSGRVADTMLHHAKRTVLLTTNQETFLLSKVSMGARHDNNSFFLLDSAGRFLESHSAPQEALK